MKSLITTILMAFAIVSFADPGGHKSMFNSEFSKMEKTITLKGEADSRTVWLNGKELTPEKSQEIINHSPDGFNWGYTGSGPAQLALAVCLEIYPESAAIKKYQDFKMKHLASLPKEDFEIEIAYTGMSIFEVYAEEIINGSGGYDAWATQEGIDELINNRVKVAEWVLTSLCNDTSEDSGKVLDQILASRQRT